MPNTKTKKAVDDVKTPKGGASKAGGKQKEKGAAADSKQPKVPVAAPPVAPEQPPPPPAAAAETQPPQQVAVGTTVPASSSTAANALGAGVDHQAGPSAGAPPEKFKLPKMPTPKFPPAHQLMPLHSGNGDDDMPFYDVDKHDKRSEGDDARLVNGWSKTLDRNSGLHKRQEIISKILSRWWFVFPQWPPKDHDYTKALEKRGFSEVAIKDWLKAPQTDENGLSKVYQLTNFPGRFRNNEEDLIDLRPAKSCPCFLNLQRHSTEQLLAWLRRAYENQIAILRELGGSDNEEQAKDLAVELKELIANAAATKKDCGKAGDPYNQSTKKHLRKLYN